MSRLYCPGFVLTRKTPRRTGGFGAKLRGGGRAPGRCGWIGWVWVSARSTRIYLGNLLRRLDSLGSSSGGSCTRLAGWVTPPPPGALTRSLLVSLNIPEFERRKNSRVEITGHTLSVNIDLTKCRSRDCCRGSCIFFHIRDVIFLYSKTNCVFSAACCHC